MKSALFARPNLKLLLLAALLLAGLLDVITSNPSHTALVAAPASLNAGVISREDLRALMLEAELHPSCQAYTQLSLYFERLGEYRLALQYLRKADKMEPLEDSIE